ncbi:hypothetical protein [Nocardia sp. NPDC058666]|uniref:hypothetical protein n=1 Tax=Nocardia sp. NPDC058666 TaxID=3346587 RepID=UPI00364D32C6
MRKTMVAGVLVAALMGVGSGVAGADSAPVPVAETGSSGSGSLSSVPRDPENPLFWVLVAQNMLRCAFAATGSLGPCDLS